MQAGAAGELKGREGPTLEQEQEVRSGQAVLERPLGHGLEWGLQGQEADEKAGERLPTGTLSSTEDPGPRGPGHCGLWAGGTMNLG